jgi:hypothetical protein
MQAYIIFLQQHRSLGSLENHPAPFMHSATPFDTINGVTIQQNQKRYQKAMFEREVKIASEPNEAGLL